MLSWQYFFDEIYLINLDKRHDRYMASLRQLDDYGINFKRIAAVEDTESGARGLRDTMLLIFNESLEKNHSNILVLEDDFEFIKEVIWVDEVMNAVVKELPENYLLAYMGGQPTGGFQSYYSAHLLPVFKYFATQSVIYSRQAIKEIMLTREMGYPIDNWLVDNIQTLGNCYAINPMLCSQRPCKSDIGGTFIDWRPFMDMRHEQQIAELNNRLNANIR